MNRVALGLKREDAVTSAKMEKWATSANLRNDTERKVFQTEVFKRGQGKAFGICRMVVAFV